MAGRTLCEVYDLKNTQRVKVVYSPEYREYVCKLYVHGSSKIVASYHTDDEDDARGTASHMVSFKHKKPKQEPESFNSGDLADAMMANYY